MTGRSLAQAAAWCEDLGLHGAVAEYGAVIWDARQRTSLDLRTPEDAEAVERARAALAACSGVYLDPDFRHGIRGYQWIRGAREPLTPELTQEACSAAGPTRLRSIVGVKQTDLVPEGCDKGRGLRELLRALGWQPEAVWAVGDTAEDLPFLSVAHAAWAPANAESQVKRELRRWPQGRVSRSSHQQAVLHAATSAACHARRACPACRVSVEDTEIRTIVELLAGRNQPIWRTALGALNRGALAMFRCERQ